MNERCKLCGVVLKEHLGLDHQFVSEDTSMFAPLLGAFSGKVEEGAVRGALLIWLDHEGHIAWMNAGLSLTDQLGIMAVVTHGVARTSFQ